MHSLVDAASRDTNRQRTGSPSNTQTTLHLVAAVAAELEGVAALPGGADGTTDALVGAVSLALETTVLAASGGEATELAVLVDGVADPVDAGVVADLGVGRVNHDDFEVLVGGVLVDPVGVQHTEVGGVATGAALGVRAEVAGGLDDDTLVLGLTVNDTLAVRALASTTADSDADDDVTFLGLVAETASLVGAAGAGDGRDLGTLAVLPCADTEEETEHVALFLLPEFFEVLVGAHVEKVCLKVRLKLM